MLDIFVVHGLEFGVQCYSGTEVLLPLWVYRDVHRVCSALFSVWISMHYKRNLVYYILPNFNVLELVK